MKTLYAIRPLLVDEDRGRTSYGAAEPYHCHNPLYALVRAVQYDRQCEGYGDFRVFNTTTGKEVTPHDFQFDAHVWAREAHLCNDLPF